jgi:hypothetical protein
MRGWGGERADLRREKVRENQSGPLMNVYKNHCFQSAWIEGLWVRVLPGEPSKIGLSILYLAGDPSSTLELCHLAAVSLQGRSEGIFPTIPIRSHLGEQEWRLPSIRSSPNCGA